MPGTKISGPLLKEISSIGGKVITVGTVGAAGAATFMEAPFLFIINPYYRDPSTGKLKQT